MKKHMTLCLLCSVPVFTNYACDNPTAETRGGVTYSSVSPETITSGDQTIDNKPSSTAPPVNAEPSIAGPKQPVVENESTTPPNQIMGSFLRCYIEESNKAVKLEVGCRFQDSNDDRILVSQLAKKAEYSLPRILPPSVSLAIETLDADPRFDVLFHLTGKTFTELRSVAYTAYYEVKLFELQNGAAQASYVDEGISLMSEPLKPWWKRDETSDTNADQYCNAGEVCRFEGSGLHWARDNALSYIQDAGRVLCEEFDDGYGDWRLPTVDELHVAYAKHIDALKPGTMLNLRSAYYWSSSPLGADQFTLVNIFTGEHSSGGGSDQAGVLCVRDLPAP